LLLGAEKQKRTVAEPDASLKAALKFASLTMSTAIFHKTVSLIRIIYFVPVTSRKGRLFLVILARA
jgi:hypothetical protein